MKNIVSGTDMKKVDSYTINTIGIPSIVLMERAALSVAELIEKNEPINKKVIAVCGTGNNGADGLAVCRMLSLKGYKVSYFILGDPNKGSDEFKSQLNILKNLNVRQISEYEKSDVVVDAIFGVGLSRNVEGAYAAVVDEINKDKNIVYGVDIPSGVNADNGEIMGKAVKANYTVTFGSYKIGAVLYPGADCCGEITVADIGYSQSAYEKADDLLMYATEDDFKFIPPRPNYSNKGTYGKVLIIAGSKDISGAAYLSALAAFRVGAGMVRVFTHNDNRQIIQKLLPEAMVNTYDTEKFDEKSLEACLKWCDVVTVGPGLSTGAIQKKIVADVLDSGLPAVIDADGINNISEDGRLKKKLRKNVIITPHLGEMSRLIGEPVKEISGDLIKYAKMINYKYNVDCVLKDARTVITTERQTFVNLSGNSGMATAGSGDVLTGIIAGLIGIGVSVDNAAVLGPYIHGYAGDRAAEKISRTSLMATDIIAELKNMF